MPASTAVITDLTTCVNNISAAQNLRSMAAAGPMMDLVAMVNSIILRFQEAVQILNYITYGNASGSQGGTVTQGGAAALLQSGDGNAANTYTKAVNVLTTLA